MILMINFWQNSDSLELLKKDGAQTTPQKELQNEIQENTYSNIKSNKTKS